MTDQTKRQYLILGAIIVAALIGIGLIAYLVGTLMDSSPDTAAATATVEPTDTPIPPPAGCIRLDPQAVIDLYERVDAGYCVLITQE